MDTRSQYDAQSPTRRSTRGGPTVLKLEDNAGPSTSSRRASRNYQHASDIEYTPEKALKVALKTVKEVQRSLGKLTISNPLREVVWNNELAELQAAKENKPTMLIAVCGATGAGKSSILNAVLDDNIVPTSGMRACTSVVTKISYHKHREIRAEITFMSEAEWHQEVKAVLSDWASHVDDGNFSGKIADLREEAKIAWEKIHAVYPFVDPEDLDDMTEQTLFDCDSRVVEKLGTVETVTASDSTEFGKKIARYIDSINRDENAMDEDSAEEGQLALWPLIKEVHVYCKAKALASGAVLVDLPGVADANAARANIAKEYLKLAKHIWILAPIQRAVDDQTAQKLLGDAFQRQLLNGTYDSKCITFIASKTDDISCSETVRSLRLSGNREYKAIQSRLKDIKKRETQTDQKKNQVAQAWREANEKHDALKASKENVQERIRGLETRSVSTWTTLPGASGSRGAGSKRKPSANGGPGASKGKRRKKGDVTSDSSDSSSDSDSSQDELDSFSGDDVDGEYEEVTPELEDVHDPSVLRNKLKGLDEEIAALQTQMNAHHAEGLKLLELRKAIEAELSAAQREKNAFCAKKRNEFAKDTLKEDFRVGLRKLEDTEAERRDGASFDPTQNTRDYSQLDLPVFTCSSRDYVRSKGQIVGDGAATCFTDAEDTEIPAVQRWCDTLTLPARRAFVKNILKRLLALVNAVESYVKHVHVTGGVAADHRLQLSYCWDSSKAHVRNREGITRRLQREFAALARKYAGQLDERFKNSLEGKSREGAKIASESALEIVDKFATMHHSTYRATMKRYGSWRRDINLELVEPFTQTIASSFSAMFETDIFGPFEVDVVNCIAQLVKEFVASAADELRTGANLQQKACRKEGREALSRTMAAVKDTMSSQRKEISRSISPIIQKCLTESYENARLEKGKGSVARIKAHFREYVEAKKDTMFEEAADTILQGLDNAAKAVGETLRSTLSQLAEKVEVNLAVIWEEVRGGEEEMAARAEALEVMSAAKAKTALWLEAAGPGETGDEETEDAD